MKTKSVAAVIAAAGRSTRMGQPKQLLPWHGKTVLASVVDHLQEAGATPIVSVIGHQATEMRTALRSTSAIVIYNEEYRTQEMLGSYQAGIRYLQQAAPAEIKGTLLALGDQPHIPVTIIRQVVARAAQTPETVVIPSFNMRRGHPFYMPIRLWDELLMLDGEQTLRTLLHRHNDAISYINVESDAILRDMDTPSDYESLVKLRT